MSNSLDNEKILFNLLIIGNSTVGKSCILTRYTEGTFKEVYLSTLGIDKCIKQVETNDGKIVTLNIWDTAGQERFRLLIKSFYKKAQGIILVYDITSKSSFESIEEWINQINENSRSAISVIILGNKIDLEDNRVVSYEEGDNIAKKHNFLFMEVSAKENYNIDNAFDAITNEIYKIYKNYDIDKENKQIKLDENKKTKDKKCCN